MLIKKISLLLYLFLIASVVSAQSHKMTTYSGTITGYSSNLGFTTGQIIIDNAVTSLHAMYLINIDPSGKFSATFPLDFNRECWVSLRFFNGPVYFEAGKKVIQNFNITDFLKVTSTFEGAGAVINNNLNKVRPVLLDYDMNAIYAGINQATPEQYKTYFLKRQAHKLAKIDSVAKTSGMDKTAYELARRDVQYRTASDLIHYNDLMEAAFRRKNNISFTNRAPVLKPVKLTSGYFNFLRAIRYNDPRAMSSQAYYEFMNRLMFMDPVYEKAGPLDYTRQIALLKTRDTTDENIKNTIKTLEDQMRYRATPVGALEKARPKVLKQLLRTNIALELDLMYLQAVAQRMDMQKDTLTNAALAGIKAKVKHKFLLTQVIALNNNIKQAIRGAKTQTGYTNNQALVTDSSKNIFVNLINRYKGKVILIDFWATWCAPCMMGIKTIAPLKAELAQNQDIVFLYITNNTSPEKTYQTVMPGIKGEHYRLSEDQYNYLAGMFNIYSIPHYVTVNKRGEVADGNFLWTDISQIKKELLKLAAE